MRRLGLAGLTIVLLSSWAPRAFALPNYGADCKSCHTGARGTMTITGNDTSANPLEACGSPDRGTLKVFQVTQGSTRSLSGTLSGVASGANYATLIKGFEGTGIEQCGALAYTGDAAWKQQSTTAPVYFTQPSSGSFTWPGQSAFSFNIKVGATTPPDYYDLTLATAGRDGSGRFYTESHFLVQVIAPVIKPTIVLSKTALTPAATQGSSPANDTFTVSSTGGTLNYTISDDATWLTVSPASGSTTGAANTITVQYNAAALAAGSYPATITVTDANATNSPQTINVTLTINAAPKPTIVLNKTTLTPAATQGSSPANDTFTVSSTGGTLNYTISDDATWLTVSPASGSTTGAANTITVQYNTAALAAGSYPATITVTDANAANSPQTVNVTLTINAAPKPTIVLSKSTLTPAATQGSSPANDTFTVSSTGGTLNYTISDDATWLTASPTSGSTTGAANTITVQYNAAALAAGSYPATITVTDPNAANSPQTINVTLTINAAPKPTIVLSKTTLTPAATQGSSPVNDTFTVSSTGGTLNYTISDDATWLTASPTSGSTTGAANTITVQYNTAAMAAGSYPATITVTDPNATNSPQTINVTLTINPAPKPTIVLSKSTLTPAATQGSSPANDTFTVSSTGGTLNYTISDDATWLTVSPASGSTTGAANTITVQYNTAALAAGSYPATITVTDPNATNSPQTVNVTLTINPAPKPTIVLSKTALTPAATQGSSPANDTFTVSSTGGTLNYTISDDATWLTVSPASGSTTGAANTITVQYNAAAMAAGSYPATITVTDPNATNSPQTINVTLTIGTVKDNPVIKLSKTTLRANGVQRSSPEKDTFTIRNVGTGTLNYTISSDATWLKVSPASGSVTTTASTIIVQYDTASLRAGTYNAKLVITANATNSPQTIEVTLVLARRGHRDNDGEHERDDDHRSEGSDDHDSRSVDAGDKTVNSDITDESATETIAVPFATCGAGAATLTPALLFGMVALRISPLRRRGGAPADAGRE